LGMSRTWCSETKREQETLKNAIENAIKNAIKNAVKNAVRSNRDSFVPE
jgi:hypothetical protein